MSGFVLLTAVGTNDLRDEFGVRSFGQRSSLIHCINKLRERSSTLNGQQEPRPQSPAATSTLDLPASSETLAAAQSDPAPIRAGEIEFQDGHGRKRRKLNLTTVATVAPQPSPPANENGYFGHSSMPIDELFFGKTQLGQAIEHPESAELTVFDTDRANDSAEHNFTFYGLQKPAGKAQYVHAQTQRYLQQDPIDLVRRGNPALAVAPYREDLCRVANKVQSAIVIQYAGDSNDPAAMRENVAYLDVGGVYNGIAQESTLGQFDYLKDKYGDGADDSDDESVTSEALDKLQAEIDKEWDDEKEEIAASQAKNLSKADVENIVDETVDSFIQQWNANKRPRKEENQAWSVWKLMKRSKTMRLGLIEDAQARIENYNSRLRGHKANVVIADCRTKDEVVKLCEALNATVMDREEQKWKINVWQRKEEPAHTVRHGQRTGAKATTSAGHANPSFVPYPEDRFSVEPGAIPALEENEDVFVTPHGSPTPQQDDAEGDGFDGSVEGSRLDDFVEADDTDYPSDAARDETMKSPWDDDQASPLTMSSAHGYKEQRQRSLSTSSSDEDRLPEMNAFFSQRPKKTPQKTPKHTFAKPSEPASASRLRKSAVIEISSDSASTPTSSSTKGRRRNGKFEHAQDQLNDPHPQNASVRDVDSWDIHDLVNRSDRKRLVIKLLREEGKPQLSKIKALWMELQLVGFREAVQRMMSTIQGGSAPSDEDSRPLLQCARLALVWFSLVPEIMQGLHPVQLDWKAVARETKDTFIPFFGTLMQRSHKLFVEQPSPSPSPSSAPNKTNISDIIEIDSDSPMDTPHKKRKRKVKSSAKAAESQHSAKERLERWKASMESSDSQQLLAMVGPDIPINPLKQDGGAHFIHPAIAPMMKEHQISGVRFMWRELTAGADEDENGQGCVLAHAMGLGKTMQTITVLVALTKAAQSNDRRVSSQLPENLRPPDVVRGHRSLRILVLCPPSLLDNWRREIEQWAKRGLGPIFTADAANRKGEMDLFESWHTFGGMLLMGYEVFTRRVNRANAEEKAGELNKNGTKLDEYLLKGPEILVADEAHKVKNIRAGVSVAVNQIETRSRIALTGTPMSNDVGEMYALISFAAPGFLGPPVEFKGKFGEPIEQGTYADSTSYEQRRSKVKLATLIRLIEPKIHRADITALKGSLQPKVEFVVTLPLTDLQRSVYNKYLDALLGGGKNDKASQVLIFSWLSLLTLLTNHPLAFKRKLNEVKKPPKSKADKSAKANAGSASPVPADDDSGEAVDYEEVGVRTANFSEETVKSITADIGDNIDPRLSAKMDILMNILELSKRCGDKVLVFSSSIPTLDTMEELLRASGARFGRIDGAVPTPKRPQLLTAFAEGLTDVLIISTKAGGVGLNIQAANRVVIMDFGFNPAHEEQAIGRAYRFGQSKPVFVYRLICGGTFEDNIYNKQLFKSSLTQRVVDKKNPRRSAARSTRQYLYPPKDVFQQDLEEWMGKDPEVFDKILRPQLSQPQGMVRKLTTIETLQREGDDAPLNAEELRQAEEEYQMSISAAMGPRGQIAPNPSLVVNLGPYVPKSTALDGAGRPKQTIRITSTKTGSATPTTPFTFPHGLPDTSTPS